MCLNAPRKGRSYYIQNATTEQGWREKHLDWRIFLCFSFLERARGIFFFSLSSENIDSFNQKIMRRLVIRGCNPRSGDDNIHSLLNGSIGSVSVVV